MDNEVMDYKLGIKISDDYYSAYVSVEFFTDETEGLYESILKDVKEANIVHGLDFDMLRLLCQEGVNKNDVQFALGREHVNGKNAYVDVHVDLTQKPHPRINDDGSVDFKDMNFVKFVAEGEVLATKYPIEEGINGMTVTGKEIKFKPGKDIPLSQGENTKLSEDGLILFAATDGIVKRVNGRLTVVMQMEVDSVGPETGNIYFSGDILVKNTIMDGYTVNCDGDLTVNGVVEGAVLKVNGNLTVGKGIKGHNCSDIVVNGDLVSNFIENANVYIKGSIETGEIINSVVLCDGQITVKGKKGMIIGGEITSKYMIEANRIGSKLGVITTINLGVDRKTVIEVKHLRETVHELKIVVEKVKAKMIELKKAIITDPDNNELIQAYNNYRECYLSTTIFLEEKQALLEDLMEHLRHTGESQLKISTIYPDTMVKIGDCSYFVDQALKDCIIKKSKDKVVAIGY